MTAEQSDFNASLSSPSSRIIFGSCNSQQYAEQPFWEVIRQRDPTVFVWAGDAVYADDRIDESDSGKRFLDATPDYLRQLLQDQRNVLRYSDLVEEGDISIFGTIDDHDYGTNNGDRTFPWKRENGMEFVEFLGLEEATSAMARRVSKGKGVYGVQVYDFARSPTGKRRLLSDSEAGLDPEVVSREEWDNWPENNGGDRTVAVFVLDVRTNKTPWTKEWPQRYSKYPEGDFLGEKQWEWFEEAIGRSRATVNIVVTGIQVHAPWFYDGNLVENWSAFPKAQHRLYQAILQPNVQAPLLVTGDVHLAQLLRKDCHQLSSSSRNSAAAATAALPSVTRPIYEITTSGMTHSWGSAGTSVCGRPDQSRLCRFYPYNALFGLIMTFAHWVSPWTALLQDDTTNIPQYSLARNIAEVEVDWDKKAVIVRVLGVKGQTLLRQVWTLDHLNGKDVETLLSRRSFEVAKQRLETDLQATIPNNNNNNNNNNNRDEDDDEDDDYICVNYRGNLDRLHFAFSIVSIVIVAMVSATYPFFLCIGLGVAYFQRRRQRRAKMPQKSTREKKKRKSE